MTFILSIFCQRDFSPPALSPMRFSRECHFGANFGPRLPIRVKFSTGTGLDSHSLLPSPACLRARPRSGPGAAHGWRSCPPPYRGPSGEKPPANRILAAAVLSPCACARAFACGNGILYALETSRVQNRQIFLCALRVTSRGGDFILGPTARP